jgi:hypothetical protein
MHPQGGSIFDYLHGCAGAIQTWVLLDDWRHLPALKMANDAI